MGVSMVAVRDMVRGECEFGGVSKGEERFNRERSDRREDKLFILIAVGRREKRGRRGKNCTEPPQQRPWQALGNYTYDRVAPLEFQIISS
jgi:hypothetical protein